MLLVGLSIAMPAIPNTITYSVIPSLAISHTRERLVAVNALVTAYSNDRTSINVPRWRDGFTASMTRARVGTIAADQRFYRFGIDVYIPGYGFGKIEDRGGKIKGRKRFDVFKETATEARKWGVVDCTVLVFLPEEERLSF